MLEINLLFFLCLSNKYDYKSYIYSPTLYYFLLQSIGSIFFIFSISMSVDNDLIFSVLLCGGLCLKLGLFPFIDWSFKIVSYLPGLILIFFFTFQKLPLLIIIFSVIYNIIFFLSMTNFLVGRFLIFYFIEIKRFFTASSLTNVFWMVYIFLSSFWLFFFFFF